MNVELALKLNKLVHDECKDVPHDIGIRLEEIVSNHKIKVTCMSCEKEVNYSTGIFTCSDCSK